MEKETGELKEASMQLVELFCQRKNLSLSKYYEKGMECIVPYLPDSDTEEEKGVCSVLHQNYYMVMQTSLAAIISGGFYRVKKLKNGKEEKEKMNVTLVFQTDRGRKIKVRHMHISTDATELRKYKIRDIREQIFFLPEMEVLYLESRHNHVVWHCRKLNVEVRGSLKEAELMLSETFLRIHRGFIINRKHVYRVSRCYAEMDNSDVIQIPVKKYCEIKEKLLENGREVREMA